MIHNSEFQSNLRRRISVWLTSCLIFGIQLLCLCSTYNRFPCLVKSKPVKQEVSHTMILLTMVIVLWSISLFPNFCERKLFLSLGFELDSSAKTIILIIPMTRPFGNVAISSQTLLAEKLPSQKKCFVWNRANNFYSFGGPNAASRKPKNCIFGNLILAEN